MAVNAPGARAAIDATSTVAVVTSMVADPVSTGLVASVARPGGNATGVSNLGRDLTGKRLELLREAVPGANRIAVLFNPDDPIVKPQIEDSQRAAKRLGVETRDRLIGRRGLSRGVAQHRAQHAGGTAPA